MCRGLCVFAAATFIWTGCYFHTAFRGLSANPGATVEVTLTPWGSDSLAPRLGVGAHAVDGRVVSSGSDTLALAVSRVLLTSGKIQPWLQERVALPHDAIASVEGRRFSAPATVLLAGGALAGLIIVAKAVKKPPCESMASSC